MAKNIKNEEMIEAVLFLAGRFLTSDEISRYTNINSSNIEEAIQKLREKYGEHGTLQIVEREGAYKMDVEQHCAHLINKIVSGSTEFSKAEQETLAIIAYKQPITQATVVKIRGNKAYDHIKHIIQAGLLKSKKAGRTIELQTEEKFYDYFNIGKKESTNTENLEKKED